MRLKMVQNHLVLLPGLDGTGELFAPFLQSLDNPFTCSVVSYPRDKPLNYQQLIPRIRGLMPWEESYTLVAESFSGPLALLFAAAQPEHIRAIVLVASFASNPLRPPLEWARFLMKGSWLEKSLAESVLRKFLFGEDCPPSLADKIMETIRSVQPEVLAHRIRLILDTDTRPQLRSCEKPILYLMGTQDKILGRRTLDAMLEVKPDIVGVEIDSPHLILQRRPREAIAAIDSFLREKELLGPRREILKTKAR
jgi:pimeloyl-[acyl-carrier protein] methyl ester esterase